MSDTLLSISQAAKKLGVAAVTLRLWERQGKIKSLRTDGNQRRYSLEMLEAFQNKSQTPNPPTTPSIISPYVGGDRSGGILDILKTPVVSTFQKQVLAWTLAVTILAGGITSLLRFPPLNSILSNRFSHVRGGTEEGDTRGGQVIGKVLGWFKNRGASNPEQWAMSNEYSDGSVLAAESINDDYRFVVNVPSLFNKNITAPNIIYGLTAGANITITGGQNPTISATFPDQTTDLKIFKTVKVGSTEISAGSKTDTLELVAGSNITLSTNTSDKKITIANSYSAPDTGWEKSGTMVKLSTAGNLVSIGAASGAAKLNLNVDDDTDLLTASKSGNLKFKLNSNGVITSGTWNGTVIDPAYGGTGVANNTASTLTISGNYPTTLTLTGTTGVTLPTTGTLATLAGTETLTNKTLTTPIIAQISNTGTLTLPTSTDTLVGRATTDTLTNKTWNGTKIAETYGGTNQTSYTTGDILYSSATNTLSKLGVGTAGQVLTVTGGVPVWAGGLGGSGTVGYWQRSAGGVLAPDNITDDLAVGGTSTASALFKVTGTTGNIVTSGTLTLPNSNSLTGQPGNIQLSGGVSVGGGTTYYVNTSGNANFNTLNAATTTLGGTTVTSLLDTGSASVSGGLILYGVTTISTTGMQTLNLGDSSTGNIATSKNISATGTLTGLTGLTVASGTVSLPAGEIGNTELANSSVTVTAGTGLSGGGTVSLGGSLSLSNAGVTSLSGTTDQVNVSGSTGAITISLPQNIATTSSPTFAGLTLSGLNTAGAVVYTDTSGVLGKTAQGVSGQVLLSGGTGSPTWANPSALADSTWQRNAGVVSPLNITDDMIIGGIATSSAKFQISSTTGNASTSGNLIFNNNGLIATTAKQTLTIGDSNTGNIAFSQAISPVYGGTGVANNAASTLAISGNYATTFTVSGTTGVTLPTTGTLATLAGSETLTNKTLTTPIIAQISNTGTLTLPTSSDTLVGRATTDTLTNKTWNGVAIGPTYGGTNQTSWTTGDILYASGTNTLSKLGIGSTNYVLSVVGGIPSWTDSATLADSTWQRNAGVVSPLNITDDMIIGGIATSSAKFQIFSASGNATTSGNLVFSSSPTIATTAKQTLTLGDSNTGNVVVTNNLSAANLSGTNTGDQTITLTGDVTGSGTGSFATTIGALKVTNGMLAGSIAASKLVGTDIATVGTITSGTWTGSVVGPAYGGTGVANNAASTLAISGNYATTFTVSGTTGVTLPTTGTLATLAGSETLTNKTLTTPIIAQISNTGTLTLPTSSDTLVGRATTDTLTNKTWNGVAIGPTYGGTNQTSWTTGDILYASGTNTLSKLGIGSTNYVLSVVGGIPSWTDSATLADSTWQRNAGTVSPLNITDDVLVGGISTAAATLRISSAGVVTLPNSNTLTGVSGYLQLANGVSVGGGTTYYINNLGTANLNGLTAGTTSLGGTTVTSLTDTGSASVSGAMTLFGTPTIASTALQTLTLGGTTTGNIQLSPGSATPSLTVTTAGNIGIGTTAPGYKLDVNGNANIGTILYFNQNSYITDTGGSLYLRPGNNIVTCSTWPCTIQAKDSVGEVQLSITGSGSSYFNGGNVGIGTITPLAKLDVNGTASVSGALSLYGTPTIATTNKQSLTLGDSNTGNIIMSGGNVGIGTTSPNAKLHVAGDINIYEAGGSNHYLYLSQPAGTTSVQIASGGNSFFNGGNVGIGTTGPGEKLDVVGAVKIKGTAVNVAGSDPSRLILDSGSTSGLARMLVNGATNGDYGYFSFIAQKGDASDPLVRLHINSSGNVGIGTTTPLAKLDVNGTASVSGALTLYGTPTIASTNKQTLTIGDSNTGNIAFSQAIKEIYGGTNQTTYTTGDILYSSATNTLSKLGIGSANQVLSVVAGIPGWVESGSVGTNYWNVSAGALFPLSTTVDLLVGGQATSSAKFQVFGGTGTATSAGNLIFSSAATIATTAKQTLTIGDANTGDIAFSQAIRTTQGGTGLTSYTTGDLPYASGTNTLGKLGIGSSNQVLIVSGGVPTWGSVPGSSCVDCILNDPGGTQTITPTATGATGLRVAQASGGTVDVFSVTNNGSTVKYFAIDSSGNATASGNLTFDSAVALQTTKNQTLTIGGNTTGNITLANTVNAITLPNTNTLTGVANYLRLSQGLSVGGADTYYINSSGNANLNALTVNSTASVSGAMTLFGTPTIATTAMQSLTLGDGNTGNIVTAKNISATGTLTGLTGLTVASGTVSLPAGEIGNTELANSSLTVTAGTGMSGGGAVSLGGSVTLTNAGVTSAVGTSNQVNVSAATGAVTFSLPQSIATNSNVTFGSASLSAGLTLSASPTIATTAKQTLTLGDSSSGNVVVTNNLTAANLSGTNTGDQTITLTGDVTGSGTGSFATTVASQTSSNWAGKVSDETGSGLWVFATSPTLTTPVLGVATATSINKVAITAPATSATLTVPDGSTVTFQGTDTYVGRATTDTLTNKTWNGVAIGATYGGTGQTTWTTGDLLYASGTNTLAKLGIGSATQVLTVSGGVPAWTDNTSIGNWQRNSGTVSPLNITDDVLVGGISTAAATLRISSAGVVTLPNSNTLTGVSGYLQLANGVSVGGGTTYYINNLGTANLNGLTAGTTSLGGTTVTSLTDTGSASVSGALTLYTTPTIATTSMQSLTLGDSSTGNIVTSHNISATGTLTGLTGLTVASGTVSLPAGQIDNAELAGSIAASKLVGTDIATVGTITTGTWNGTVVGPAYGGTGIANNAASTLTISGNYATTLTVTGTTGVTLPTTGTLATLAGTETLSAKTLTAPKFADLGFIADPSGNELIILDTVASAVNEVTLANAATGGGPTLAATGGDTNVALSLDAKAAGALNLNNTATGDILLGGGSGSTGCTITNSTGNIVCNNLSGTNTGDQTITLTGDVTGTGTGSFATTIGALKVTNAMLAGSIAASKLVGTDIATVGTITTGTWNGTVIGATYGGTGQTTWTTGDILYASGTNTLAKLAIGSTNQSLIVSGGVPAWGTVSSSNWQRNSGTVSPLNITDDLLVGGISTASAKFAVVSGSGNITTAGTITLPNSNTLTGISGYTQASAGLSVGGGTTYYINNLGTANLNAVTVNSTLAVTGATTLTGALTANSTASVSGSMTLFGTPTIATTAKQSLTLGDSNTGNIIMSGGNVGIGTTGPGAKLHVDNTGATGTIRISGIGEGTADIGKIEFLHDTYNTNPVASIVMHRRAANASGALAFRTADNGGTPADRLTISPWGTVGIGYDASEITDAGKLIISGNVGIGTTGPATLLEVNGQSRFTRAGVTTQYVEFLSDASYNRLRAAGSSKTFLISNNSASSIMFGTGTAGSETIYMAIGNTGGVSIGSGYQNVDAGDSNLRVQGNVGIGTTSPLTALQVVGSASASANLSLYGQGTAHTFNILNAGTLNIQRSVGGDAGLATSLFVDAAGNVGIGTTGPGVLFEISSANPIMGYKVSGTAKYYQGVINTGNVFISGAANNDVGFRSEGGNMLFSTDSGGNTQLYLKNGGNVGIGTTGPSGKLHLYNSTATTALDLILENTVNGYNTDIQFKSKTAGGVAQQWTVGSNQVLNTSAFEIYNTTAGSEPFTILTNGNVGIGTTTPLAKLDVNGTASVSGALSLYGTATIDSTAMKTLTLGGSTTGNISIDSGTGVVNMADLTASRAVFTDASSNLTSTGASADLLNSLSDETGTGVAVFATSPTLVTPVLGVATGTSLTLSSTASVSGALTLFGTPTIASTALQTLTLGGTTTGNIQLSPGSATPSFVVTTAGQVGIGTTGPARILEISHASIPAIAFRNTGQAADQKYWEFSVSGTQLRGGVQNDANTTEAFWLQVLRGAGNAITSVNFPNGNVGIGTTGPGAKLDVTQASNAQGQGIRVSYGGNWAESLMSGSGYWLGVNGTNRLFIDQSSGNVGIGNVTPLALLDVTKNTAGTNDMLVGQYWSRYTTGTAAAGMGIGSHFVLEDAGGSLIQSGGIRNYWVDPAIGVRSSNTDIQASLANAEVTVATFTSSGNVGIGTTSPLTALQIVGSASESANLSMYGQGTAHTFNILNAGTLNIQRSVGGDAGLATSLFVDAAGNVGIGTTGPGAPLDVNGKIYSRTGGVYTDSLTSYAGSALSINAGSSNLNIVVNGSERMRVDSVGNVGIGTTGPVSKLAVIGSAGAPSGSFKGSAFIGNTADNSLGIGLGGYDVSPYGQWIQAYDGRNTGTSVYPLLLNPNGGNVGIGTTAPGYKLEVNGTVGMGALTATTGTYSGNILLNDGSANSPDITFQTTSGTRLMDMDGSVVRILNMAQTNARLSLTDAGNLSVDGSITGGALSATSGSFSNKLTVAGVGGLINSGGYIGHIGGTDSDTDPTRYMIGFSHGNSLIDSNVRAGVGMMVTPGGAGNLVFETGGGGTQAERMRINGSGNVGIGTTSPLAKLHVEGNCVTGDTLLPIRRRRRKDKKGDKDNQDDWEDMFCFVCDILPDDQVLSLDEATQELRYARINKRMDMGIQDIFELTTKSGRKIRVTGNHPFLVQKV